MIRIERYVKKVTVRVVRDPFFPILSYLFRKAGEQVSENAHLVLLATPLM